MAELVQQLLLLDPNDSNLENNQQEVYAVDSKNNCSIT